MEGFLRTLLQISARSEMTVSFFLHPRELKVQKFFYNIMNPNPQEASRGLYEQLPQNPFCCCEFWRTVR